MDLVSLIITATFIVIIIYITVFGFWPLNKKLGFFSILSFWRETKKIKKNLEEAIEKLPDKDHRNEFTRRYQREIDPYFSEQGAFFTHLWIEFKEQLIEPGEEEAVFQNSMRPKEFFIFDDLLKKQNLNFKLIESMPGILVGLGVLGTFTGLSISILRAMPKLPSQGDMGNISEAVNLLISGAGVAFFTSVVGLLASLIFNLISDKRVSLLQSLLNKFNSRLEKSLKFVTEEHLLVEYLKEVKQQGKHLANMDEKLALKIGDRIEESVKSMGNAIHSAISESHQNISERFFEDISSKMTDGMGDFSTKQRENLEKTLSSIQNNIPPLISRLEQSQKQNEETTKNLINQMSVVNIKSQEKINESLAETTRQMKSDFSEITKNLKEGMSQTLSDSSGELKTLISSLGNISKGLISNLGSVNKDILEKTTKAQALYKEHFDETLKHLSSFADRLERAISEVNTVTTDNIKSAGEKFNQVVESQTHIMEQNQKYIHSLSQLSEKLESVSLSVSDMTHKMPEYMQQINSSNEYLKEIWQGYEKRFEAVDEKTATLFENVKAGLESISTQSMEHVGKLNQQFSNISKHVASMVDDLKEGVEEFGETISKL